MSHQCCSKCNISKPYKDFVFDKRYNRPKKKCRVCDAATYKAWVVRNRASVLQRNKDYRDKNPDFRKRMVDKTTKNQHLYQAKRNAAEARRRCSKLSATPAWLSKDHLAEIENLYWMCRDLRAVSGQDYHVDHIVPLRGENVCGLHVPWNLQILPSDMNIRKSNKYKEI